MDTELEFKVGDWVISTKYPKAFPIKIPNQRAIDTQVIGTYSNSRGQTHLLYTSECKLWLPIENEWCWYSKWYKCVCLDFYLCKFIVDMNEVEPEFKHKYEPFIGALPSFLKEQDNNAKD